MKELSQLSLAEVGPLLRSFFHAKPRALTSLTCSGPEGPDKEQRDRALEPLCACLLVSCRESIQRAARQYGFEATLDLQAMATTASPDELLKFFQVSPEEVFKQLEQKRTALQQTLERVHLDFNDLLVLLLHVESDAKTLPDKVSGSRKSCSDCHGLPTLPAADVSLFAASSADLFMATMARSERITSFKGLAD